MLFENLPESIQVLGVDIPFEYVAGGGTVLVLLFCVCCCRRCCRSKKIVSSEKFRWPSSARFLKRTNPGRPPKLVLDKYEAPIRTDKLPEGTETYWVAKYQPNGERREVTNSMYLCFIDGDVFGVGYEQIRSICKIKGGYKYNRVSNQTVIAITCKFSNELDTVMFHGWANGTAITGNCYMHEIDRFSVVSDVPGLRQLSADKFKGSFLMLKKDGMGEPSLRSRLHTRRVHKWAGDLYPDQSVPMPSSPLRTPGSRPRDGGGSRSGEQYTPVEGESERDNRSRGHKRSRSKFIHRKARGARKFFSKITHVGRKKHSHFDVHTPTSTDGREQPPPWVHTGNPDVYDSDDSYEANVKRGRLQLSPAKSPRQRPQMPTIDNLNYLEMDGVPGRSGPSMV